MPDSPRKDRLILLAEDNDDVRQVLKAWLERQQFKVLEAADGGQLVELCQTAVPDLVMTDLQMPGIDGVTAIKYLRRSERLRHIPVIAFSAYGQMGMDLFLGAEEFGEAPIEYLAKPASLESLQEVLDALLK